MVLCDAHDVQEHRRRKNGNAMRTRIQLNTKVVQMARENSLQGRIELVAHEQREHIDTHTHTHIHVSESEITRRTTPCMKEYKRACMRTYQEIGYGRRAHHATETDQTPGQVECLHSHHAHDAHLCRVIEPAPQVAVHENQRAR